MVIAKPDTVISSAPRRLPGYTGVCDLGPRWPAPRITEEIRLLIPKIGERIRTGEPQESMAEMLKLGFMVSERTVARYLRRIERRGEPV